MRVAILKYGVGNVYSIKSALERLGASAYITGDPWEAARGDAIILPGVGNMRALRDKLGSIRESMRMASEEGTPILGICLGMQLLYTRSEEDPETPGLGVVEGVVERIRAGKVPRIGWYKVYGGGELLDGVEDGSYFYFLHSYAAPFNPPARSWTHAGARYAASIESHPWYGVQFHPERSGRLGRIVLWNWLRGARR